jgi:hypothetical protein
MTRSYRHDQFGLTLLSALGAVKAENSIVAQFICGHSRRWSAAERAERNAKKVRVVRYEIKGGRRTCGLRWAQMQPVVNRGPGRGELRTISKN